MLIELLILVCLILIYYQVATFLSRKDRRDLIINNKSYYDIIDKILDTAYESIYKDQIVPYSTSGMTPNDDQLETTKRNCVKLFIQLCGPSIHEDLINFYGSETSIVETILLKMQEKMDSDEILDLARRMKNNEDNPETPALIKDTE